MPTPQSSEGQASAEIVGRRTQGDLMADAKYRKIALLLIIAL
jgi:hypothetical protein